MCLLLIFSSFYSFVPRNGSSDLHGMNPKQTKVTEVSLLEWISWNAFEADKLSCSEKALVGKIHKKVQEGTYDSLPSNVAGLGL